jgi:hypothetical protein
LAAVHNDSAPRVFKALIARSYWGFLVHSFGRRPVPFFSVHVDNLRPPAPAVILLNSQDLRIPAIVYSISCINKMYYFITLPDKLTWTINYSKNLSNLSMKTLNFPDFTAKILPECIEYFISWAQKTHIYKFYIAKHEFNAKAITNIHKNPKFNP